MRMREWVIMMDCVLFHVSHMSHLFLLWLEAQAAVAGVNVQAPAPAVAVNPGLPGWILVGVNSSNSVVSMLVERLRDVDFSARQIVLPFSCGR
ncbi:hypothetical protein V6N11_058346 [Hibiscus sabdariffa]|uniref:Secreted protein n=1 Tax=Hibiscus sabdariffa TaxID=183260 RepID=A0ABR2U3Z3_9ROSI